MKIDLSNGLPESVLAKIRKHSEGAENLSSRFLPCHYCKHNAIMVYADSKGHVGAKCRKCGKSAIYNVALRRNRFISFRQNYWN